MVHGRMDTSSTVRRTEGHTEAGSWGGWIIHFFLSSIFLIHDLPQLYATL